MNTKMKFEGSKKSYLDSSSFKLSQKNHKIGADNEEKNDNDLIKYYKILDFIKTLPDSDYAFLNENITKNEIENISVFDSLMTFYISDLSNIFVEYKYPVDKKRYAIDSIYLNEIKRHRDNPYLLAGHSKTLEKLSTKKSKLFAFFSVETDNMIRVHIHYNEKNDTSFEMMTMFGTQIEFLFFFDTNNNIQKVFKIRAFIN